MNKFFELSFDDQRRVLQQASARCGHPDIFYMPQMALPADMPDDNILWYHPHKYPPIQYHLRKRPEKMGSEGQGKQPQTDLQCDRETDRSRQK